MSFTTKRYDVERFCYDQGFRGLLIKVIDDMGRRNELSIIKQSINVRLKNKFYNIWNNKS